MSEKENVLLTNKHILLCLEELKNSELEYLKQNFCGTVSAEIKDITPEKLVYLYGDMDQIYEKIKDQKMQGRIRNQGIFDQLQRL